MEIELKKDNFDSEVINSDKAYLIDFWAPWCGPCRILSPIVEEIAGDLEGKISVGKVNVDEEPELGNRYNVMSIPTLKFFKAGKQVHEMIGAAPKETIMADINKYLLS